MIEMILENLMHDIEKHIPTYELMYPNQSHLEREMPENPSFFCECMNTSFWWWQSISKVQLKQRKMEPFLSKS